MGGWLFPRRKSTHLLNGTDGDIPISPCDKNVRPFAEPPESAFLPMPTTVFRLADRFFNPPESAWPLRPSSK
jgi:hypothetical protein